MEGKQIDKSVIYKYENICFEGGGDLGFAYIGLLIKFWEE